MRRGNFLLVILVALATYLLLGAVTGRRNGFRAAGWHAGDCHTQSRGDKPPVADSTAVH